LIEVLDYDENSFREKKVETLEEGLFSKITLLKLQLAQK